MEECTDAGPCPPPGLRESQTVTPVETALDLVVDENWPERDVVDPVKLDQ